MNIHPNHLEDLRASGLSDETIEAAGIYSEADHVKLAGLLGRKRWDRKQGAALVFPFFDPAGAIALHRVKPDVPAKNRNGRPAKYLAPSGSVNRAYISPATNGDLTDTARNILVTEGEKKTLKATQEGFCTVGLTGVDSWHNKRSSALIADLERIEWKGRRVYIAFDSDAIDNENIRNSESLLAAALQNRGATVKIVRLPAGPDGEKAGLDDFLVAHEADALWRLIGEATEPEAPDPALVKGLAASLYPEDEAKAFLEAKAKDGHFRLRFWRDTFWAWRYGRYVEVADGEVQADVVRFLNRRFVKIGRSAISNVVTQIKAQCLLPGRIGPPVWLDKSGPGWPVNELVVTRNKLIHLPSLFAGEETYSVSPTPALFSVAALDFDFAKQGDCPRPERWLQFLDEIWDDDEEAIEALQLWFGYTIVPNLRQHKLVALFGPPRAGKGVIVRTLRSVVGEANTAAPTLSSFATNFGLWPLIGKTLAVVGDARLSGRPDAAVIVERILSIAGEDALTIDRKFLPPVTCTLPTRLMIVSNELPRLADASGALASRMIVLRLTKSWLGKEDKKLGDTLAGELPGILLWAMDGWQKLQERGALLQPQSGAEVLSELEDLTSPVGAFVRQECEVGADHEVGRADLYSSFSSWAKDQGQTGIPDEATFGRDLRAACPEIHTARRRVAGARVRYYTGIRLTPP